MHRNHAPKSPRMAARPAALAFVLLLALAGCGENPKPELSGHFGPGSGGPVVTGPILTVPITKSSGTVVGYADYDSSFFDVALGATSSSEFENLTDDPVAPTIGVTLSRITGRPDTPCRYQAAILARDDGYDIGKSGDRENDRNLDFYEVDLKKGAVHVSLFCVTLGDQVGTAVQVLTSDATLIHSLQVHYLLNTIRKP